MLWTLIGVFIICMIIAIPIWGIFADSEIAKDNNYWKIASGVSAVIAICVTLVIRYSSPKVKKITN